MTTDEELYLSLFKQMYDLCMRNDWGDPFSYARSREIFMSIILMQTIASTFSGPDATDKNGDDNEYKSTTAKEIKGTYTGISVQPTWEEQEHYLVHEKIGKYVHHYFARFSDGKIVELWELDSADVLALLLPKLKKKYPTILTKKDPRLSANLTKKEIHTHGRCLIGK